MTRPTMPPEEALRLLRDSLDDDALTDAMSAEEVDQEIRDAGGDPEAIVARGRAIVADLIERRRAVTAPRCSCTHEAGDSRCDAHPSCSECGESTARNVDDCADHCPLCASVRRGDVITDVAGSCASCVGRLTAATNPEATP